MPKNEINLSTSVQDLKSSVDCSISNGHMTTAKLQNAIKREQAKAAPRTSVTNFLQSRLNKLAKAKPAIDGKAEVVGADLAPDTALVCNQLYRLAEDSAIQAKHLAERAAHYAVLLGIRLKQIKAETPHGQFTPLFADGKNESAFVFGIRTAQNYMRAAEGVLARKAVTAKDKKTIAALAINEPDLTDKDHALLNKATDSQTLEQLYLDFGIIRRTKPPVPTKGKNKGNGKGTSTSEDIDQGDAAETYRKALQDLDKAVTAGLHIHLHPDTAGELIDGLKGHIDTLKGLIE